MGQKYAAYDAEGKIVAFYDSIDSPVPESVTNTLEITDDEWQECLSTQKHTIVDGQLKAPTPPTEEELLAQAKNSRKAMLESLCAEAITAGFKSSALGTPYTYPSKLTDQQNLQAAVTDALLANDRWNTPLWCTDEGGNWAKVNHTASQVKQVYMDGRAAIKGFIDKKERRFSQIDAATSANRVNAIGWR